MCPIIYPKIFGRKIFLRKIFDKKNNVAENFKNEKYFVRKYRNRKTINPKFAKFKNMLRKTVDEMRKYNISCVLVSDKITSPMNIAGSLSIYVLL